MAKNVVAEAIVEAKELMKLSIEKARLDIADSVSPAIAALLEASLKEGFEDDDKEEDDKPEENEAFNSLMEKIKELDPEKYEAMSKAITKPQHKEEEEEEKEEDMHPAKDIDNESLDIEAALAEIEKKHSEVSEKKPTAYEDNEKEPEEKIEDQQKKEVEPDEDDDDTIDEEYIAKIMAEIEKPSKDQGKEEEEEEKEEDMHPEKALDESQLGDVWDKIKKYVKDPAQAKKDWDEWCAKNCTSKLPSNLEAKEPDADKDDEEEEPKMEQVLELKNQLFEMNILSAKLLYQNKLLISENFSDAQKARIIKAFDKARTVNEVKLIFETLDIKSGGKKPSAKPIAESLGFIKIGNTQAIVESASTTKPYNDQDPAVLQMMQRAGLKPRTI